MSDERGQASPEIGSAQMWDSLASAWDRYGDWHARTTGPLTTAMVDVADVRAGQQVVEVACGPTADCCREVARRLPGQCRVIASDRSPAMVDAARRRVEQDGADIELRVLDVMALDLADGSVDRIFARWVYMLLDSPAAGLAEARRALRPRGRLVFAVFGSPEQNPFFILPATVLIERGLLSPAGEGEPSMFALADGAASVVESAGLRLLSHREVPIRYGFGSRDELWAFVSEFAGPVSRAIREASESERASVRAEVERRAARYADGSGYSLPGLPLVLVAEPVD
ncbi:MAG TPA: class I SAM-dependent methyltransferase [Nocardioidaceae bacterium]|nr:class I SAM-dependent methyltransferase [Nocardioidaceae bacterium]